MTVMANCGNKGQSYVNVYVTESLGHHANHHNALLHFPLALARISCSLLVLHSFFLGKNSDESSESVPHMV